MYVTLHSSTCFEHQHARLQEEKLYYHSIWYRHSEQTTAQSALIRHTVLYCTESDDTRCCDNTICSPENEHVNGRNMLRIVM